MFNLQENTIAQNIKDIILQLHGHIRNIKKHYTPPGILKKPVCSKKVVLNPHYYHVFCVEPSPSSKVVVLKQCRKFFLFFKKVVCSFT